MAAVPITFRGNMYPRDKSVAPYPFTSVGFAEITGLEIDGGPIVPPDQIGDIPKPPGDWEIWPGPGDPDYPGLPDPILPPEQPPAVIPTPHLGWNYYPPKNAWYYVYAPGAGQAQPKTP